MKDGFDVHDYKRRMELAVIKLKENKRVDPHNRIKIFRFLDFAETQGLSLPRRIRYLQNLTKLAAMLARAYCSVSVGARPLSLSRERFTKA